MSRNLNARFGHVVTASCLLLSLLSGEPAESADKTFPIFRAVEFGTPEQVARMLDADPSLINSRRVESSLLNLAIWKRNQEMIHLLMDRGADVQGQDRQGYPIHVAAFSSQLELVKELFAKGAKLMVTNSTGQLPIHRAAVSGNTEIVSWLIEKGLPVDAMDSSNTTPLSNAAFNGFTNTISLLLKAGANINSQDKEGMTPLHWAVFNARRDAVELLLKSGANVNLKSKKGRTPLALALREDDKKMADQLRKYGAK